MTTIYQARFNPQADLKAIRRMIHPSQRCGRCDGWGASRREGSPPDYVKCGQCGGTGKRRKSK